MAAMKKKIVVSYKSVIDVEIFSCVENYISYVGYPWQDIIDDKTVYDEDGFVLNFYIKDQYELNYNRNGLNIEDMNNSMLKYIQIFNLEFEQEKSFSSCDLINCIVGFRGITV
jgi:AAA+ superfamily predicted ATPase